MYFGIIDKETKILIRSGKAKLPQVISENEEEIELSYRPLAGPMYKYIDGELVEQ